MVAGPPPTACHDDDDCLYGEICDLTIPACVTDTVLEDKFEDGFNFATGGAGAIPTILMHPTGGNPDGFVEFNFPGAPFRWLLRSIVEAFWPQSAPFTIDTIDFSIDVDVIEAGTGVIGGWVAPVIFISNGQYHQDYVGPLVPVRPDDTTSGWRTISINGSIANDFCPFNGNTGDRDCSDPSAKPNFICSDTANMECALGGFYFKSEESSFETIRLGFDNWRMIFNQTP